jgi:uncharacterized protein
MLKYVGILFCSLFLSLSSSALEVPAIDGPVVDNGDVISFFMEQKIEKALAKLYAKGGPQVQVLTVKNLEGENISSFSLRAAEQWKLGGKETDNGLLFVLAVEDRKMRIEVGSGLEGDFPDIVVGRILDSLRPYFRQGDYETGILIALQSIADRSGKTLKDAPVRPKKKFSKDSKTFFFYLIVFILIFVFRFLRFRTRSYYTRDYTGGYIGSSTGGFGSGWSGGGSSWSGGGGGFSGGGASSDW